MRAPAKHVCFSLRDAALCLFGLACGMFLATQQAIGLSRVRRPASSQRAGGGAGGSAARALQERSEGVTRRSVLCPTNTSAGLSVWLHFVQKNAWRTVFDDTIGRLESSSLMKHCGATLHLGSPQGELSNATTGITPEFPVWPHFVALQQQFPGRVFDTYQDGVEFAETGELATIVKIRRHCAAHPRDFALYLHDKGTRRPSGQDSQLDTFFKQADWRKLQEYFLVEIFEDCLNALDQGANTCGALLRKWPHLHYSGNFWWARCDYINTLPPIQRWRHYWETHFWAELYLGGSVSWNERKGEDGTYQWIARMHNWCVEACVRARVCLLFLSHTALFFPAPSLAQLRVARQPL